MIATTAIPTAARIIIVVLLIVPSSPPAEEELCGALLAVAFAVALGLEVLSAGVGEGVCVSNCVKSPLKFLAASIVWKNAIHSIST